MQVKLIITLILISLQNAHANPTDSLYLKINNSIEDTNRVILLLKLGNFHKKNFKDDSAVVWFKKAFDLSSKLKSKKFVVSSSGLLAISYANLGEYNLALNHHQKSLELKEQLKDVAGVANSLNNIADIKNSLADYTTALEYHFKSLKIREALNDEVSLANTYNNLAVVYTNLLNFKESLRYHFKSLEIREKHTDKNMIAMSYGNIALNYFNLKDYNESIKYNNKAIEILIETKNTRSLALNYGNLGNVYYGMEDYDKAKDYYSKSLDLRESIKDKRGIAVCCNNIANCYIKFNKFDEAEPLLQKALSINKQIGSLDLLKSNFLALSKVYGNKKDFENALIYFKKYTNLKDSLLNNEIERKATKMQIQYEFDKQQAINEAEFEKQKLIAVNEIERQNFLIDKSKAEMALLERENKLNELKLTTSEIEVDRKEKEKSAIQSEAKSDSEAKKLVIKFTVGIAFLLIVIIGIIIRSLFINKQKNAIIANSLIEKETLLKEIHHRVKNNLQVISSLLNLQSRYINDPKAINAINESKERINAISLLHKEIYQTEVLKIVNAKTYFTNLAKNLQNTFDPGEEHELLLHIEELYLDIDTLIPLGLIVNELITNAFKYSTINRKASISFTVNSNSETVSLSVQDNGIGFPAEFDPEKQSSLGVKLIALFAIKIKASVDYRNDNGALVKLTFPKK